MSHEIPTALKAMTADAIEDLKDDLDYAIYQDWLSGDEVARHAIDLIVNNIRRDPRFASMSILDVEWLIRDARRDLAEDVSRWIDRWASDIEHAARALTEALGKKRAS